MLGVPAATKPPLRTLTGTTDVMPLSGSCTIASSALQVWQGWHKAGVGHMHVGACAQQARGCLLVLQHDC